MAKATIRKPAAVDPVAGVDYKVINLRIDPSIWRCFREIARYNGQSMVGRLRVMIRRDVEESAQVVSESA